MGYKDPNKQREYQKRWIARRRAAFFKGKSCKKCGSTKQLELHHRERGHKFSPIPWSYTEARQQQAQINALVAQVSQLQLIAARPAAPRVLPTLNARSTSFS